jgi:hypothetical protein
MSKKIELTKEQVDECIRMYTKELLGSTTISEHMGIHKTIIIRTLKENGVVIGPSGRRNIGGRSVAQKKYETKVGTRLKRSEFYKKWSKKNRNYVRKQHTKWREENREHVNAYSREYNKNKCAIDPRYRLSRNTRTALWTCLKEKNVAKYRSTFALLGYTIEELMQHLEKQFTEGMTWDNYGQWHVDHIRPMSSFNFTSLDDPEFKECWDLCNLQPLWGTENLSKGSRYLLV